MSDAEAGAATRFIILCLARTGSSHLGSLLDSHPQIRCYGEILNLTHPKAAPERSLIEAETDDAVAHAREVLAEAGHEAAAVGFKLPINSLREHPSAAAWAATEPGLRIVRLRRHDSLALLISRRMLQATLVSQSTDGDQGDTVIEIEPQGALRALERIEAEDDELDRIAAPQKTFQISYEELVAAKRLDDLQRFLGVEPAPLASPYERLSRRPPEEAVSNWPELREALEGTRFAGLPSAGGADPPLTHSP